MTERRRAKSGKPKKQVSADALEPPLRGAVIAYMPSGRVCAPPGVFSERSTLLRHVGKRRMRHPRGRAVPRIRLLVYQPGDRMGVDYGTASIQ